jgi:hypothetical protein
MATLSHVWQNGIRTATVLLRLRLAERDQHESNHQRQSVSLPHPRSTRGTTLRVGRELQSPQQPERDVTFIRLLFPAIL